MMLLQAKASDAAKAIAENDAIPLWLPPPKQSMTVNQVLFGIGQTLLWPFALAIALALRITRVSVEVKNWARG
jgi:hypothetical protein